MELEVKANEFNKKCLKIGILFVLGTLLLNELNIFIIDKYLVRIAATITCTLWLIALGLLNKASSDKSWAKYVSLCVETVGIYIMYMFMTYHIILFLAFPFIIAAYYGDKKLTGYVYLFSVVCVCLTTVGAYQFGLCDMNMVAFTKGVVSDYGKEAVIEIYELSMVTVGKLLLFFAFPRCGTLLIYAFAAQAIARTGNEIVIQKRITEEYSKIDKMTGLYNQSTYINDVREVYAKKDNVGVIFMDLNNLKMVNDKFGHEKGDEIIIALSKSIKYLLSNEVNGYRIGGDEFVIFVDNSTDSKLELILEKWKAYIDGYNENHEDNKCIAAYGYSVGNGSKIVDIIEDADKKMYYCKKKMKENSKQ